MAIGSAFVIVFVVLGFRVRISIMQCWWSKLRGKLLFIYTSLRANTGSLCASIVGVLHPYELSKKLYKYKYKDSVANGNYLKEWFWILIMFRILLCTQ